MIIYVMTHKPVELSLPKHYQKLFVGAGKLTAEEKKTLKSYVFDDCGENISQKNSSYCELTGMYWIWKNRQDDIVGLTHYRRFFGKPGELLSMEEAKALLNDSDIIVAKRQWVEKNVKVQFEEFHNKEDLALLRTIMEEKYPQYVRSFDCAMSKCFLFSFNMLICKKELFDQYCTWLFDILAECERRTDLTGYDTYQKRIFGFLSERLLMVYLLYHNLKISEVEVVETELDKSVKWASKKWEMITIVKNFFGNRGTKTMRYGK